MASPLYSLHLFAGAGGGLLADRLSGIEPVVAVELEEFPRRILALRWPRLAIWDDVRTFRADNPECADAFAWLREHAAELVVAGGFPCQDISAAGTGRGLEGERSGLWREFARILREIRPGFVFVENSAMLVSRGLGRVLGDLAALGYAARWNVLPASAVGALHERERIWITAVYPPLLCGTPTTKCSVRSRAFRSRTPTIGELIERERLFPTVTVHGNDNVRGLSPKSGDGLATVVKRMEGGGRPWPTPTASGDTHYRLRGSSQASQCLAVRVLADADGAGRENCAGESQFRRNSQPLNVAVVARGGAITDAEARAMTGGARLNPDWVEFLMGWPIGHTDPDRDAEPGFRSLGDDPATLPRDAAGYLPRITDRREHRVARIKALGNGQVPLCAAVALDEGLATLSRYLAG